MGQQSQEDTKRQKAECCLNHEINGSSKAATGGLRRLPCCGCVAGMCGCRARRLVVAVVQLAAVGHRVGHAPDRVRVGGAGAFRRRGTLVPFSIDRIHTKHDIDASRNVGQAS